MAQSEQRTSTALAGTAVSVRLAGNCSPIDGVCDLAEADDHPESAPAPTDD